MKIRVPFKGGKTETLTTFNPKPSPHQVKTQPGSVGRLDDLKIADLLNERAFRPGGPARRGTGQCGFTATEVTHTCMSRLDESTDNRYRKVKGVQEASRCEIATFRPELDADRMSSKSRSRIHPGGECVATDDRNRLQCPAISHEG